MYSHLSRPTLKLKSARQVFKRAPVTAIYFWLEVLTEVFILAVLVLALDMVAGFGGMVSLCHGALMGVGAYAYALLSTMALSQTSAVDPGGVTARDCIDPRASDRGGEMISFKGAQFPKDVILFAVFVYVSYTVLYRDLEEIMTERGLRVDHATLNRWVARSRP